MGLTALNSALSGLAISQAQIDIISANVSNAGTEGYTRKILPQSAIMVNGQAIGVEAETITRVVDMNISQTLWTQISTVALNDVQAHYLDQIGQFHGPPDKELSVAAEISALQDAFALLSDNPTDQFVQAKTVDAAVDTATKINNFSDLITQLRNDVENEIADTVRQINDYLNQIASANTEIQRSTNLGQTIANAEDVRDQSVKELSSLLEISFFTRGDGVMVVQTDEGVELAATTAKTLTFDQQGVSALSHYPDSLEGVHVGDPDTDPNAIEITDGSLSGRLEGLLILRDETFPKQMAQLDELAYQLAARFDAQGITLFTDQDGLIPAGNPPNLTLVPETPVAYVGFSSQIQVNVAILEDNGLLQTGTNGAVVQNGSNEVIRRILDFTFSEIDHQEAVGTLDLRLDAPPLGPTTLQEYLGLSSENLIDTTRDLTEFVDAATFIAATNGDINAAANVFTITFEDAAAGLGPVSIDVDIDAANIVAGGNNFMDDLVTYIEGTLIPALPLADQTALTDMNVDFLDHDPNLNPSNGGLRITSNADITIDATVAVNAMGANNLALLGLSEGTFEATDPYFDVAVGNNNFTRITIEPGETQIDLETKLRAVPGLAVDIDAVTGVLSIRPGEDFANPLYGGDMRLISGPYEVNGATAAALAGADGISVVSALFGSFNAGVPPTDVSPITDVNYGVAISNTDPTQLPFREDFLGPGANISTNIVGTLSLEDYAQKMVNEHTQELRLLKARVDDDDVFRDILNDQLLNQSGVNIDQELSNLILVQTAYGASARVLTAVDQMFQELLNSV